MKWLTVLLLPLMALTTSNALAKSDPKQLLSDIANYIDTRWDDVPVLETTRSTGGSLTGTLHYQTDIVNCFFFDELDLRLTEAHLSFTTEQPKEYKLQSITAGIGKRIENGWNMFHKSEPYMLKDSELTGKGLSVSDIEFTLDGFICEELMSADFPSTQDSAWIVLQVTYSNRGSVFFFGPLRAKSQL